METVKDRISWIDSLKGLLILLVIIGHMGYATYASKIVIFDVIYSFHMTLFIFLSGFVISSISSTKLMKRIRSLLFPFLIVGTLFSLAYSHDPISWLFLSNKHYFWYLLVLLYCVFIVYALQCFSHRIRVEYWLVSLLGGGGHFYTFIYNRLADSTEYK